MASTCLFDRIKKIVAPTEIKQIGIKTVPIERILPAGVAASGAVDAATREYIRPTLIQIGGFYVIQDGKDIVKAANIRGNRVIEAEITKYESRILLHPCLTSPVGAGESNLYWSSDDGSAA